MIIGGKCSLSTTQILDRKSRGCNFLEFHTEASDLINIKKHLTIKDLIIDEGISCYSIHSPMKNFINQNCCLTSSDSTCALENELLIKKSIDLASELCCVENPVVVIHPTDWFNIDKSNYSSSLYSDFNKILELELCKLNEYVQNNYPHICLGIENTTPFTRKNTDVYVHLGAVLPNFAETINSFSLSNIKLVLDICHAESTCRFYNLINASNKLSIYDFLDSFYSNLGLVHLNNLSNLGDNNSNHSTPFLETNKKDMEFLYLIFKFLKEHSYTNYITIEVLEDDYLQALNYSQTLKSVLSTLNKFNDSNYII